VVTLAFKLADDRGRLLLDLKDLRALLEYAAANAQELQSSYGNISAASVGAIPRGLLALEQQRGAAFVGGPMLNVDDLLEVGDRDKPRLVFFFDEAHLLFSNASKVLLDKIEQVVRLIRSKGVGVFFVTQSPLDIPDTVLGQLGNRIQFALRAFTPRDPKAAKAAATTMRANPKIDTEKAITELGVGEALISFLDDKGRPGVVERAWVLPLASRIGPITSDERKAVIAGSSVKGTYEKTIDRESAYEKESSRCKATTIGRSADGVTTR
jgi:DNA helicase HerA-like ATPase